MVSRWCQVRRSQARVLSSGFYTVNGHITGRLTPTSAPDHVFLVPGGRTLEAVSYYDSNMISLSTRARGTRARCAGIQPPFAESHRSESSSLEISVFQGRNASDQDKNEW